MPVLSWLQVGAGAVAAFALSWLLHTVDVGLLEDKQRVELNMQIKADIGQCERDKQLTKDANDALQKNINVIAAKLAAAKRMHVSHCVATRSDVADAPSGGNQYAGQDGISSDWLREYGAECETYRSEVITLDNFGAAERVK